MRTKWLGASALALAMGQIGTAGIAAAQTAGAPPTVNTGRLEEIVVTAQKRSEKLQRVPQAIQVLDSKKLSQLNVNNFQDYIKYIPSLSTQTGGPNQTTIYLRGVVDGGNANHSGPLPVVGSYFDELPITTIGGTLDVHPYDLARVEVLEGPQGTLYGASSMAGTVRYISNQPNPRKFEAGYSVEFNALKNGEVGGVAEGFVNVPLNEKAAIRVVGFHEHDAGFIDNVYAERTYATSGVTINNRNVARDAFNPVDVYGGRAALKVDLSEDWTVTPQVIYQDTKYTGIFGYEPSIGDLKVNRFYPDSYHDRWVQAALNVTGHIGDYTLTYAGGFFVRDLNTNSDYTDYSIFYDNLAGSGAFWLGADGNPLPNPSQRITGRDHFNKVSNEIRIASPLDQIEVFGRPVHFIIGAFQEEQNRRIFQDYIIPGLTPDYWVGNFRDTIWLTNQLRTDRDIAAFGELTVDLTDKLSFNGGVRPYYYDNSLTGFFGFNRNYSSRTGESKCFAPQQDNLGPCTNLNASARGSGETHKINFTYKINADDLVYFTYSTGFRPGGVNRRAEQGAYQSDELTNFEVGFKSSWLDHRLVWNTAGYIEDWNNFQFAYLGQNSFTIVKNAPSANIKGLETAVDFRATDNLTLSGGVTLTEAQLSSDFCTDAAGVVLKDCSATTSPYNYAKNGNALPYTPSVKGYGSARYTFPMAGWSAYVQGDVSFRTRQQVALRSTNPNVGLPNDKELLGSSPADAVFGISAGATRGNMSIDAFIKNIGDARMEQTRYTACTVQVCAANVPGIPRSVYVVPTTPFTVGIRLSQKF